MIALIDADSLVHASYHVNKNKFQGKDLVNEIVFTCEAMMFNILDEAEKQIGVIIDNYQFFFTACTNNFRNKLLPNYKDNRESKPNELLDGLEAFIVYLSENYGVHLSDELEADDLIPKYIKENGLKLDEYVIVRTDKDLAQLEGFHFNFGKVNGMYKGLDYITKKKAFKNFCELMLIGDSSDNIKGVKGIGKVKANQRLKDKSIFGMWREVVKAYLDKEERERLKINTKIIRLN